MRLPSLSALVAHYRSWIAQQKANIRAKPKQRHKTATELLKRTTIAADRIDKGNSLLEDEQVLDAFCIASKVMAVAARRRFGILQGKDAFAVAPPS
ncbi:MAG TPA: hypothetical protein VMG10_24745 [Gemmataceae bacterium]|nr:hypothetical protein [Gemmataceae bacterium]